MRYPGAKSFDGIVLWGGGLSGPLAVPGSYQVKLTQTRKSLLESDAKVPDTSVQQDDSGAEVPAQAKPEFEQVVVFEIIKDPRSSASDEDLQTQFDFLIGVRDKLTEVHETIERIRDIRQQVQALKSRIVTSPTHGELVDISRQVDRRT